MREFPGSLERSVGVFVCVSGFEGDVDLDLDFTHTDNGDVLLKSQSLGFSCSEPTLPVEFAVELPPLPLPRAGRYAVRLAARGTVLGEAPVIAALAPG